jgi:hypothetical protein
MHFFNMLMIARMGRTIRGWIADYNPGPDEAPPAPSLPLPPLPPLKR